MENAKPYSIENRPEQLASEFLNRYRSTGDYLRENIKRLAELATSTDEATAQAATRAIFASLVEPLADSFDPQAVTVYNRLFAQLIETCRGSKPARLLDNELSAFGLSSENDLIARAERLRRVTKLSCSRDVKLIIVLSRVTLGADVAITSVIIERLKRRFPNAEIVVAGGRKMEELFGGDRRLRFCEINYKRAGATLDRLLGWTTLLTGVRELLAETTPGSRLVVDPDSRLTQLGLLPLTPDGYLFFPSREYKSDSSASLGQLASQWLDEVFDAQETIHPGVCLKPRDLESAKALVYRIRADNARPLVTINFGVGENPAKRVSDEFEQALVGDLLRAGATVIFDKGAGEDETRRADAVIRSVEGASGADRHKTILEFDEATLPALLSEGGTDARLLVWRGRIGLLAALIAQSDLYIGYDSAGQHIASALGVPLIDVFAGFNSPRMLERWKPAGPGQVRVVQVDSPGANSDQVLSNVMRHARSQLQ